MKRSMLLVATACATLLTGCLSAPKGGGEGSACERRADCELGLQCIEDVCTAVEGTDAGPTDGGNQVEDAATPDSGTTEPDAPVAPCGGPCPTATPICDEESDQCRACTATAGCSSNQVCDVEADACVECLSDVECDGETVCNLDTNACVECVGDEQCGSSVCDLDQNTCVQCNASEDCNTGACDTTLHVCVGCLLNDDCVDSVCDVTETTCVECIDDMDCRTATPRCDATAEPPQCVECMGDNDCAQNQLKTTCDDSANHCVECLANDDCDSNPNGNVCDASTNSCVECLNNLDCPFAVESTCTNNVCQGCSTNADCGHIAGKGVCDAGAGECVQCTPDEDSACGSKVCISETSSCSPTVEKGSANSQCDECIADSHCGAGLYCVPTRFMGSAAGNYCLKKVGGCSRPFLSSISRTSIDGEPGNFCGLPESLATCPAYRDMVTSQTCTAGNDGSCGDPSLDDGLCKKIDASLDPKCTLGCGTNNHCPVGFACDTSEVVSYCAAS